MEKTKYAAIAGDVETFADLLADFQKSNRILQKFISTQVAAIQNPKAQLLGVTGQPEMIQTVIVSALIEYTPKKTDLKVS